MNIAPLSDVLGAEVSGIDIARDLDGVGIRRGARRLPPLPGARVPRSVSGPRRPGWIRRPLRPARGARQPALQPAGQRARHGAFERPPGRRARRRAGCRGFLAHRPVVQGDPEPLHPTAGGDAAERGRRHRLRLHDQGLRGAAGGHQGEDRGKAGDPQPEQAGQPPRRDLAAQKGRGRGSTKARPRASPMSRTPIVRTHPETGEKSLYVQPRFTIGIEGMDDDEAQPLLDILFAHQIRPEFVYLNEWRDGDLLMWDNRLRDPLRDRRLRLSGHPDHAPHDGAGRQAFLKRAVSRRIRPAGCAAASASRGRKPRTDGRPRSPRCGRIQWPCGSETISCWRHFSVVSPSSERPSPPTTMKAELLLER